MSTGDPLTFQDPKLQRPGSVAAGIKNLENARQKRKDAGKSRESITEDRDNPELELIVAQDPVAFMRKRLTTMLVRELAINDSLYSTTPIEHKAISDSNKRLMELGEALKALPNQSDIDSKGSQRSLSELIQDAMTNEPSDHVQKASALSVAMLERAEAAFGIGAAEDSNGAGPAKPPAEA